MAGGRLVLPATDPVFTSGGLLNVGATLTVYDTGTTNLANIFADPGLSTSISNPQVSNQAGRFYTQSTQICADATVAYDVVLTLTDGEIFTYTQIYCLGPAPTITGYAPINSPVFTGVPTAPTPAANDSSSKIATTQFVASAIAGASIIPPGQYGFFAMSSLPAGWLLCSGAAVSRTTYAALFGAIGAVYGSGDGTTTFNLPNFQGYFPRGLNTTGSGPDPSRALGTVQTDMVGPHNHLNGTGYAGVDQAFTYGTTTSGMPGDATTGAFHADTGGGSTQQGYTSTSSGTETRPQNLALVIGIHI